MRGTGGRSHALCLIARAQPNRNPSHAPLEALAGPSGAGGTSGDGAGIAPIARAHETPTPAVSAQIGTSKHARCPWKKVRSAHQNNAGPSKAAERERCAPSTANQ